MVASSSIIGWYGPLIDLSDASAHIDDFVQLLVFVHSSHSQPIQKANASNSGGTLLKTNIQVGDDTRSFFSASIWQKHMGSMIVAGDILLLQNVKIVKYRNILEAATIQISSLLILVRSYEFAAPKAIHELAAHGQLGETAKAKLGRVVNWVQRTGSALRHVQNVDSCQRKGKVIKNWKAYEEKKSTDCLSIFEALHLTNTCQANLHACISEIFVPFISRSDGYEVEQMFLSKRLLTTVRNNIVEDLISIGCKLCGASMVSSSVPEKVNLPLCCKKGSKYRHEICRIYRPFLLYVWDQGGQIPLLVMNKAADILFGNITADNVYKCYQEGENQRLDRRHDRKQHHFNSSSIHQHKAWGSNGLARKNQCVGSMQVECSHHRTKPPDFYRIWLILLKTLLQYGRNSPYRFEINVDREKDIENGRFELVSLTMPRYESGKF